MSSNSDNRGRPGPPGLDGLPGASAYEVAVLCGYQGSESEWLASLRGQDGAPGTHGAPGKDGAVGPKGDVGRQGVTGRKGEKGEWGPMGPPGPPGPKGDTGPAPDHQWYGTHLRFQKPDGRWGEYVDLKGPEGERGPKGETGHPGGGVVRVIGGGGGTGGTGSPGGSARYQKNLSGLSATINKSEHELDYVNSIMVRRVSDGAEVSVEAHVISENVTIFSNVSLSGHVAILS